MAKPKVELTNSFNEWRVLTNTISDGIGDVDLLLPDETLRVAAFVGSITGSALTVTSVSSGTIKVGMIVTGTNVTENSYITAFVSGTNGGVGIYTLNQVQSVVSTAMTGTMTTAVALNDVYDKKANRSGDTFTGAVQVNSTLGVLNAATFSSTASVVGNFTVNTNKFVVTAASGNTAVAGTLGVAGATTLSTTLGVTGLSTLTGGATFTGTLQSSTAGKFSVASTTGNTVIGGTLSVTGLSTLTGGATFTGTLQSSTAGKFTVASVSGNTAIGGTLAVTGASTLTGMLNANGRITIPDATVTTSTPLIIASQTWNNAATAFSGIQINIANTASSVSSKVIDITSTAPGATYKFGVSGHGAVTQILGAPNLAREINSVADVKHVREYQDLVDGGVQGLPAGEAYEWGCTYNAYWNTGTSTYLKDDTTAGAHSFMERLSSHFSKEWWFSDGTAGSATVAWVRKVDFDLLGGSYSFVGALSATGNLTIGGTIASTGAITAPSFIGSGASLTALNGTQITTGTVASARIAAALTGKTYNALSLTANAVGFKVAGGTTSVGVTFAGGANYTISGSNAATYTLPAGTQTLASLTGTETLTNKTLTSPVINGGSLNNVTIGSGTANQMLGLNAAGSALEYKTFTSSDGTILFTHTANGIDIKTAGIIPTSTTMQGDFAVQPVGAPSATFQVAAASGNTTIAGTLTVAGATSLGATAASSLSTAAASITEITNGDVVRKTFSITTNAATANQVVVTLPISTYRSACYEIQAVDATGAKFHRVSINAIHNGVAADSVEYGVTALGALCGTFNVDVSAGNMRLLVTPTSANVTVFKVAVAAMKI